MGITIAMYSHDSVGLGHARRNRALAFALTEQLPRLTGQQVTGLLIVGHPEVARDRLPQGWDWLVLPGVVPGPAGHIPRQLGVSAGELAAVRGAVINAALLAIAPDLFIVDRHGFGIGGELKSTLHRLRHQGCRTVLGLREVLDDPATIAQEWERAGGASTVADAYDALWIYGDPSVYDPRMTGEIPAPLARIATATGYLSQGRPQTTPHDHPEHPERALLTVLGGGSDGADLARIAAQAHVPAGFHHHVVTGPQMAQAEAEAVRDLARPGTSVHSRIGNLPGLIDQAAAVVCMAGYNTMAEVLATSTPALVVPRVTRRTEQLRRANALAAAGVVDTVPLAELTPATVSEFFSGAVTRGIDRTGIARDGLNTVPRLAAGLLAHRAPQNSHPSIATDLSALSAFA